MNTRFVEAFVWAARLGSFRTASDRLHITQAAVSNRVASLEEDIGARPFERDARELRLTPVGVRLMDYGEGCWNCAARSSRSAARAATSSGSCASAPSRPWSTPGSWAS